MERALRYLLTEEKRFEFKERSRYKCINPDQEREEKIKELAVSIKRKREEALERRMNYSEGFFSDTSFNASR